MTEHDRRTFIKQTAGGVVAMALTPSLLAGDLGGPPSVDSPIVTGVIGIGRQGRSVLAELQKIDAFKVVAICDNDAGRLRAGGRRAPGANSYATHNEMLDKEEGLQAVIVCTPTDQHSAPATDALSAGKHVYCEAPLSNSSADARAIVRAAREGEGVFHAGLQARSNPVYQLARTFFRSDSVRDLISMRAQDHDKTSWRVPAPDPALDKARNWKLDPDRSTGLLGELGTHQFDVFHWYTDRYPVRVTAHGGVRFHEDGRTVADTVAAYLEFDDGAPLQYDATLANSYGGRYEVLHGSNAAIKLAWSHAWMFKEADAPTQGWEVYANRQQFHNDEGITLIAGATQLAAQGKLKEGVGLPHESLYYAMCDFATSIVNGSPATTTAEEGFRATAVGIAAHESLVRRKTVEITEDMLRA